MRQQDKKKLIRKMNEVLNGKTGNSLYVRPFENDERIIAEIARATGEKKSAIAQKLLHLALRGKQFEFGGEKHEKNLLEWLVNNEKHKTVRADARDARVECLEEHGKELGKMMENVVENSRFTRLLVSEIYCAAVICVSYLNQIFTKIIEYFSPHDFERKNSSDFANRNVLGLIEHSLNDLKNLAGHYNLDLEENNSEVLYLTTKIERIKARLLSQQNQSPVE